MRSRSCAAEADVRALAALQLAFGEVVRMLQGRLPKGNAAEAEQTIDSGEQLEELFDGHLQQLALVMQAMKQATFFLAYHTDGATSLMQAIESHIRKAANTHASRTELLAVVARYKLHYLTLQVCFEALARIKFPALLKQAIETDRASPTPRMNTVVEGEAKAAKATAPTADAPPAAPRATTSVAAAAASSAAATTVDTNKWPCGMHCQPSDAFVAAHGQDHFQVCMLFHHPRSTSLYRVHYKVRAAQRDGCLILLER
jgi:hypothetical protein